MRLPTRFRCLSVLALAVAAPLAAQTSCPMQTTQHIPENVTYGPMQACSGVSVTLPDVQIRIAPGQCPTFVVLTPPHDIAVPAATMTYVEVTAQQPITMVLFECKTRWLLFLPIGDQCVATRERVVGSVPSMVARPCPAPQG